MTEDEARARLAAGKAEYDAANATAEAKRLALYEIVREIGRQKPPVLKQVEIVEATGWTREHIRNIVGPEGKSSGDRKDGPSTQD